jgi:hypothetical protein
MSLLISGDLRLRKTWQPMDPDAAAYITAVETADNQALEERVKIAIDNFVLGCKADGIWSAIKASCILAGARTLNGALTPLVGTAPTSFNFVSGDYNRKTGLVGDGSTKYLDSNRNNNADPQNSKHLAIYANNQTAITETTTLVANSVVGVSRAVSGSINIRYNRAAVSRASTSEAPTSGTILVFNETGASFHSDARLAFYSIGENLNLALLDARVTTLINAFGAAIP